MSATLHKAVYEEFLAESVTLEADGTALRHTVNAVLRSAGAEARIDLSGAYSSGIWQGEIVRFSGRDRVGHWNLTAPSAIAVAAGRVTLAPLVLTGAAGADRNRRRAEREAAERYHRVRLERDQSGQSESLAHGGARRGNQCRKRPIEPYRRPAACLLREPRRDGNGDGGKVRCQRAAGYAQHRRREPGDARRTGDLLGRWGSPERGALSLPHPPG